MGFILTYVSPIPADPADITLEPVDTFQFDTELDKRYEK